MGLKVKIHVNKEELLRKLPAIGAGVMGTSGAVQGYSSDTDSSGKKRSKAARIGRAVGGGASGAVSGYLLGSVPGALKSLARPGGPSRPLSHRAKRELARREEAKKPVADRLNRAGVELAQRHARHLSKDSPAGRPFFAQKGDLTKMNSAMFAGFLDELAQIEL